jgi:hypothetical protein
LIAEELSLKLNYNVGDSAFNTQIYASLGVVFVRKDTVAAFTIFQFVQNIGSAIGFIITPYVPVHGPSGTIILLIILSASGLVSVLSYLFVALHKDYQADESVKNINNP